MNRFFLGLFLTFLIITNVAAQGAYQRKRVQPSFFVPGKELNRAEKLPPFPVWEEDFDDEEEIIVIKKKPNSQETPYSQSSDNHLSPEEADFLNSLPPEKISYQGFPIVAHQDDVNSSGDAQADLPDIDIDKILPKNPDDAFEDKLTQTKAYTQRRSEYEEALQAIAENGAAPMTPTLAEDLGKMDSNAKIWVSENFGIKD